MGRQHAHSGARLPGACPGTTTNELVSMGELLTTQGPSSFISRIGGKDVGSLIGRMCGLMSLTGLISSCNLSLARGKTLSGTSLSGACHCIHLILRLAL